MTSLPPHIKEQLREFAREENLSEADVLLIEEGFCKLVEVNKKIIEEIVEQKIKNAA